MSGCEGDVTARQVEATHRQRRWVVRSCPSVASPPGTTVHCSSHMRAMQVDARLMPPHHTSHIAALCNGAPPPHPPPHHHQAHHHATSPTQRTSRISMVMLRLTTSRLAKSLAVGAYRSMNRSPSLLRRMPPSPREPSVIRQPAP